ncbi:MAG: ATP-binding protein [Waddliaceae bacterium]
MAIRCFPPQKKSWRIVIICALIPLFMGIAALIYWHLYSVALIEKHRLFQYHHYNSALSTTAVSLAMLLFLANFRKTAIALATLPFLIGLLTLFEHIFDTNLRVDNLFIFKAFSINAYPLGRMTPLATFEVFVLGIAMLLITFDFSFKKKQIVLRVLGVIVFAICVVALAAALIGVEVAPKWAQFSYLDSRPAVEMGFLGFMIIAYAWGFCCTTNNDLPPSLPFPTTGAVILGALYLWQALNTQETVHFQRMNQAVAEQLATSVKSLLNNRIDSLTFMAKRWENRKGVPKHEWEMDSMSYVDVESGLVAIEWADSSYHVRWSVPQEDESLENLDIMLDNKRGETIQNLEKDGGLYATPVINLVQGGDGFLIYVPLFPDGVFDGFIIGAFNIEKLFTNIIPEYLLKDYAISIYDGGRRIYHHNPDDLLDPDIQPEMAGFSFLNNHWFIDVRPEKGLLQKNRSSLPMFTLVIGFFLAAFVFTAFFFGETAYLRSRQLEETLNELNESTQQTHAILHSMGEGVFGINHLGKTTFVNPTVTELVGFKQSELINKSYKSLKFLPAEFERIMNIAEALTKGETQTTTQLEFMRKNGSFFPVECTAAPIIIDKKTEGAVMIFRDVTERKQTEEQLLNFVRKLEETNHKLREARAASEAANYAKSAFLANMSHEIRTPLNGVIGMAGILLASPDLNEKQKKYIGRIDLSGKILLELINDILDFSKIEAGEMRLESIPFDLHNILLETEDIMSSRAQEKKLDLSLEYPDDLPKHVIGDPSRLRQVVNNLLSNAIKFTSEGSVILRVIGKERTQSQMLFRIEIIDTGIGIPESKIDDLFEKFSQADTSTTRKFGGTGLGLSISKQLVELMDGELSCNSEEGKGSTFWMEIVFALDKESRPNKTLNTIEGMPVLIVNKNKSVAENIEKIFTKWKMRCVTSKSIEEINNTLKKVNIDGNSIPFTIITEEARNEVQLHGSPPNTQSMLIGTLTDPIRGNHLFTLLNKWMETNK